MPGHLQIVLIEADIRRPGGLLPPPEAGIVGCAFGTQFCEPCLQGTERVLVQGRLTRWQR